MQVSFGNEANNFVWCTEAMFWKLFCTRGIVCFPENSVHSLVCTPPDIGFLCLHMLTVKHKLYLHQTLRTTFSIKIYLSICLKIHNNNAYIVNHKQQHCNVQIPNTYWTHPDGIRPQAIMFQTRRRWPLDHAAKATLRSSFVMWPRKEAAYTEARVLESRA
jgi:hypothetical protein